MLDSLLDAQLDAFLAANTERSRQHHEHGIWHADHPREALRTAGGGNAADVHFGLAKLRIGGCDANVARERKLRSLHSATSKPTGAIGASDEAAFLSLISNPDAVAFKSVKRAMRCFSSFGEESICLQGLFSTPLQGDSRRK